MKIDKRYYEINDIKFMDAEYIDGSLIFYDIVSANFCMLDIDEKEVRPLKYINNGSEYAGFPRKIIYEGNYLYCVQSDNCVVYQFKLDGSGRIELLNRISFDDFNGSVKNAFYYNGKLWLIPTEIKNPFIEYNLSSKEAGYFYFNSDELKKQDARIREVVNNKSNLYISFWESNKLLIISLDSKITEIVNTNIEESIEGMATRESDIILRAKGGKTIYSWNPDNLECKVLGQSEKEYEEMGRLIVHSDGTIIICPMKGKDFYYVDEKNGSIERIEYETEVLRSDEGTFTIGTIEYKNNIYIYPWASNRTVVISRINGTWKVNGMLFKMKADEYVDFIKRRVETMKVVYECKDVSLSELFLIL
jgi:hypothetical protein